MAARDSVAGAAVVAVAHEHHGVAGLAILGQGSEHHLDDGVEILFRDEERIADLDRLEYAGILGDVFDDHAFEAGCIPRRGRCAGTGF